MSKSKTNPEAAALAAVDRFNTAGAFRVIATNGAPYRRRILPESPQDLLPFLAARVNAARALTRIPAGARTGGRAHAVALLI